MNFQWVMYKHATNVDPVVAVLDCSIANALQYLKDMGGRHAELFRVTYRVEGIGKLFASIVDGEFKQIEK